MGGGIKYKTTHNLRKSEAMRGIIIEKLRRSE
jgi:hypothetical protein